MKNESQEEDPEIGIETDSLFEHFRFQVDPGQGLTRIDVFLSQKIPNASRTKVQAAAEAGNILVNEKPVKSNYKVKPLDIISVLLGYPPRESSPLPENIPLDIVYEDNDLLIVNKQAGMVVHPGFGNFEGTLVNALLYYLSDNPLFLGVEPRPGLVHRIDKDTSGLLVIAKNELALNKLAKQFFNKTSVRSYHALIWGNPTEDEGTLTGYIGRSQRDRRIMSLYSDPAEGKLAITHFSVIERFGYVTLIECRLETGRTHQIRAQFAASGRPLFNDESYGGAQILKGTTFTKYKQFIQNCFAICPRQALHAKTLGFIHPSTGESMLFDSELPPDFSQLVQKWRKYVQFKPTTEEDISDLAD
jgi:23S rRNA pseudouridine1911/1915/1917 synthase